MIILIKKININNSNDSNDSSNNSSNNSSSNNNNSTACMWYRPAADAAISPESPEKIRDWIYIYIYI